MKKKKAKSKFELLTPFTDWCRKNGKRMRPPRGETLGSTGTFVAGQFPSFWRNP